MDGAKKNRAASGPERVAFLGVRRGEETQLAVERLASTTMEKWASGTTVLTLAGVRAMSRFCSECWSARIAPLASTNQADTSTVTTLETAELLGSCWANSYGFISSLLGALWCVR